jgi:hypothetical protein
MNTSDYDTRPYYYSPEDYQSNYALPVSYDKSYRKSNFSPRKEMLMFDYPTSEQWSSLRGHSIRHPMNEFNSYSNSYML